MDLSEELKQLKSNHAYRSRRPIDSPQSARVTINNHEYLNFCSNNYLGLANDTRIKESFCRAVNDYGVGSGASQLICGYQSPHYQLEETLADFIGTERVLLFSNGYHANLGVQQALFDKHSLVFMDKLNHASLYDGVRLSGARLKRYPHRDPTKIIDNAGSHSIQYSNKYILSDGLFSMDGDLAPIPKIFMAAEQLNAEVVIDDAHGFGIIGEQGRGIFDFVSNRAFQPMLYIATLAKALGCYGAFVAGDNDLIEYLIQKSRTLIYTTAIPAALAAAAITALSIVKDEPWRRAHLEGLVDYFTNNARQLGLPITESPTGIQAVIVGDNLKALKLSEQLKQKNILAIAIRPPTVPLNTARIRISLTAEHALSDVDQLLEALSTEIKPDCYA